MFRIKPFSCLVRLLVHSVLLAAGSSLPVSVLAQAPPIGRVLYEKLAKSRKEYEQAMANGDSMAVAETCYLMGKRYSALGHYLTAQKWFTRSLRIREPRGPSEAIGKVYLRIAENQFIQQNYQAATQAAHRAEANMQHVHSRKGLMSSGILLAGVYSQKHGSVPTGSAAGLDSALYFLRRSEKLALELKNPLDIGHIYSMMSDFLKGTDSRQAISYLKKAYAFNGYDKYSLINLYCRLANYYLTIKQPGQAKKWLKKATALRDSAHMGDYSQNRIIEEAYTNAYKQSRQWEQAFDHQEKYTALLVQILKADRDGAITRVGMLYENEKKEATLKAQKKELELRRQNLNTQQQLTLMTGLLFGVACVGCAVFFWLFKRYQRLSGHNAKLVKEQNHRVKNNLQAITSLLGLQFNRLTNLAARQALEESLLRVEAVALVHQRLYDGDRLVEVNLEQYIPELVSAVLRTFNFHHLQPVYRLDPVWLDADATINVGLLLNELVTNACKYAFPHQSQPLLEVGFQAENGLINLWFTDNGPGFIQESKTNSFGMKLIDMVARKLRGKYHFDTDQGCHFAMTFKAPLATPTY